MATGQINKDSKSLEPSDRDVMKSATGFDGLLERRSSIWEPLRKYAVNRDFNVNRNT